MRQSLLTLTLFLATLTALGQEPFERVFSVPGALNMLGATLDPEGHYVFAVQTPAKNIQVTRIAPDGTHEWTNEYTYFVDMGLYGRAVAAGPDGIVVAGYTMGSGTASRDGVLLRIDYDGTLLDSRRIDVGGGSNALHTLNATSDGFISGGRTEAYGGGYDMLLTKFNTLGEIQWARAYGSPVWDWAYEAIQLADGGYAMIGYGDGLGTGFSPSAYLVRTDALGNELWAKSISSGNSVDEGYVVAEAPDGSLFVGGRTLGYIVGDVNAWITKLTPTGDHVWTRVLQRGVEAVALIADPDGGVTWTIHPQWVVTLPGGYELAWGKFDGDGNVVASKVFGSSGNDYSIDMFKDHDGSVSILAVTNSYGSNYENQVLLVKTDTALNAACDPLDSNLAWRTDFTAIVQPFTSAVNSGFLEYPWPLGTEMIAVDSYDPCCAIRPSFNPYDLGTDGYTWGFANTSSSATSFLWDFGDGTTSTENSPTHAFATSGTYMVCLTAMTDCGEGTTCHIVGITVGIAEQDGGERPVVLYPSPADESVAITAPKPMGAIELFDNHGRLAGKLAGEGRMHVDLATGNLPAGLYTVKVLLEDGRMQHLRLMVSH